MGREENLEAIVDDNLGAVLDESGGRVVLTTTNVNKVAAVKLHAVFFYANLAGSASLAEAFPWATTARIIRAFLDCSTRLIRFQRGEIRSFDFDRVMGVLVGDEGDTDATRCAREILLRGEHHRAKGLPEVQVIPAGETQVEVLRRC